MATLLDAHESLVNSSLRVELSHAVSPQSSVNMATSAKSTTAGESYYNVAASLGSVAGTLQFNSAAISATRALKGTDTTAVLSDTTPITVASLRGAGATVESAVAIAGNTPDLTQVFTGLHQSEELTSVLQQQPQLVQGMLYDCSNNKGPY